MPSPWPSHRSTEHAVALAVVGEHTRAVELHRPAVADVLDAGDPERVERARHDRGTQRRRPSGRAAPRPLPARTDRADAGARRCSTARCSPAPPSQATTARIDSALTTAREPVSLAVDQRHVDEREIGRRDPSPRDGDVEPLGAPAGDDRRHGARRDQAGRAAGRRGVDIAGRRCSSRSRPRSAAPRAIRWRCRGTCHRHRARRPRCRRGRRTAPPPAGCPMPTRCQDRRAVRRLVEAGDRPLADPASVSGPPRHVPLRSRSRRGHTPHDADLGRVRRVADGRVQPPDVLAGPRVDDDPDGAHGRGSAGQQRPRQGLADAGGDARRRRARSALSSAGRERHRRERRADRARPARRGSRRRTPGSARRPRHRTRRTAPPRGRRRPGWSCAPSRPRCRCRAAAACAGRSPRSSMPSAASSLGRRERPRWPSCPRHDGDVVALRGRRGRRRAGARSVSSGTSPFCPADACVSITRTGLSSADRRRHQALHVVRRSTA